MIYLESENKSERTVASVLARKILEIKDSEVFNPHWKQLDEQSIKTIKYMILESFEKETDKGLIQKITLVLGEIANNVFNVAPTENVYSLWPELIELSLKIINLSSDLSKIDNSNIHIVESRLNLFKLVFGHIYRYLEDINKLDQLNGYISAMEEFIKYKDLTISTLAIAIVSEMSFYCNKKQLKHFKNLIFSIMKVTLDCLNSLSENELKLCLKSMIQMFSDDTAFLFKPHFDDLFILMGKISECKKFMDEKIRDIGFEVIISLVEHKSSYLKENQFKVLVESLFKYALELDQDISDEWLTPKQDSYFDQEMIDEPELSAAINYFERLSTIFKVEKMNAILSQYIVDLLNNGNKDWRFKYVGIITLRHMIPNVEEMIEIENIFTKVFENISDENPKIRYACISTLEELADTYKPHFSMKHSKELIPFLLSRFDDNVLKIQLEACEALNTLMSNDDEAELTKAAPNILDKTFSIFLKNEIPNNLRECLLNVTATLVCQIGPLFAPFSEKCFEIIVNFFSNSYMNKINKPLYGNLFECISLIGPYQKDVYYKILPNFLDAIIEFQSGMGALESSRDYVQDTIERLSHVLKKDFPQLIPKLVDSLIKIIKNIPEMSISSTPETSFKIDDLLTSINSNGEIKIKLENIKTTTTEEMASGLETLNKCVQVLDNDFLPYLEVVNKEILFLLSYEFNSDIREAASDMIPEFAKLIKKYSPNNMPEFGKTYCLALLKSIERELDNSTMNYFLENFIDLLKEAQEFLNNQEINSLFDNFIKQFYVVEKKRINLLNEKSEVEKKLMESIKKGNEDEESDDEFHKKEQDLKEDLEQIEDQLSNISEIIGQLFSNHKNISQDIVKIILSDVLPNLFRTGSSLFENKMGLYLIDDIVEYLGQDYVSDEIWIQIAKILINYSNIEESCIRQPAVYGMGMFAQNSKRGFDTFAYEFTSKLFTSLNIPKEGQDEEDWLLAKDNSIAALGRIIKYQNSNIKPDDLKLIVSKWLQGLPIKTDDQEKVDQHELLIMLLESNSDIVTCNEIENYKSIIKVVSRIYQTDLSTDALDKRIEVLKEKLFKTNENFIQVIKNLYTSSDKKVVQRIKKLFE